MKIFKIIVYFCVLVFCSFSCLAQTNQAIPRFEKDKCAIQLPEREKNYECGYLVVRENRTVKNSPSIRLPIVILKSDSATPQPDPVLRTLGGPGGSSLRMARGRPSSPWLKDRDVIVFEQRGTKYAQPALECPEVDAANIASVKERLGEREKSKREFDAAKLCYERLMKSGIDLAGYNSAESAADIEDLRRVLKLEKLNLYGVSYSARLMLNFVRDYPTSVRSLVMESTLPLEVNYDEVGVDGIKRTFDLLFVRCAADADCAKKFPDLEKNFYTAVRKANANPIAIDARDSKTNEIFKIELNGNDLITWAIDYLLSSESGLIASAPLQINRVSSGDFAPLQNYANDKLSPAFYAWGMRFSVWCSEEMPFENKKKIAAQANVYPDLKGYEVQRLPSICSVWKVPPAKSIENKPVASDVPALIVAGEYDAYTPPAWGKLAAKNLKNSFFLELPWLAHGAGFSAPSCYGEIVSSFFDNPANEPKTECVERIRKFYKFNN